MKAGMLVNGTITSVKPSGLVVRLAPMVQAFLPNLHVHDAPLLSLQDSEPLKRQFSVGKTLKCRVLNVDLSSRRIILTHKPTLVKSKLPILTEYTQATVGKTYHGFVTQAKDFGWFHFFLFFCACF